jgi:hypothetical protein
MTIEPSSISYPASKLIVNIYGHELAVRYYRGKFIFSDPSGNDVVIVDADSLRRTCECPYGECEHLAALRRVGLMQEPGD